MWWISVSVMLENILQKVHCKCCKHKKTIDEDAENIQDFENVKLLRKNKEINLKEIEELKYIIC